MNRVSDIVGIINGWAPSVFAWEKDNIGLIIGDRSREVKKILVALEVTREIVHEAIEMKADTLVVHHPIIFHPIRQIHTDSEQGSMISSLLRNDINVIAAHTNADAARDGLNYHLCHRLGLINVRSLGTAEEKVSILQLYIKSGGDALSKLNALLSANSIETSFSFKMDHDTTSVSMEVPGWKAENLKTKLSSHMQDLLLGMQQHRLDQSPEGFGLGAYGDLVPSGSSTSFLNSVKKKLYLEHLKTNHHEEREIKRVAVCGGAGSSLLPAAVKQGADMFITSDVPYHTFFESMEKIIIVDAGHYETEAVFIDACIGQLSEGLEKIKSSIEIISTKKNTNPIRFM